MLVDQINLNQLRVFTAVYRQKSMTKAARELHLTQSGVSQHIGALEHLIGLKLFSREARALVPTPQAHLLYKQCDESYRALESTVRQITGRHLSGIVRVGMPPEFGANVLVPLIGKFLVKHADVQVRCHFGLADEISGLLVKGELDFAYVDGSHVDPRITLRTLYKEVHELCGSKQYLKSKISHQRSFYETLDFVAYMEGEPLIRRWFKHHLPGTCPKLQIRAYAPTPLAVLHLILSHAGVGILPGHRIATLPSRTHLLCVPGSGTPLISSINEATLDYRVHSPAASTLRHTLATALGSREDEKKSPAREVSDRRG